ncbi:MAG: hypothetical protein QM528_07620 [Phycisphaerales bacterium]|nr:hypothetical protein [Phycisphaerales bacterium]
MKNISKNLGGLLDRQSCKNIKGGLTQKACNPSNNKCQRYAAFDGSWLVNSADCGFSPDISAREYCQSGAYLPGGYGCAPTMCDDSKC